MSTGENLVGEQGAGCKDDNVGFFPFHDVDCYLFPLDDSHVQFIQLGGEVVYDLPDVFRIGSLDDIGHVHEAAQEGFLGIEKHFVAPQGRHPGGLEPGGPRSGDENLLLLCELRIGEVLCFSTKELVDPAADREHAARETRQAGRAGSDIFRSSLGDLVGQLAIGEQAAHDPHDVNMLFPDHFFCEIQVKIPFSRGHDRNGDGLLGCRRNLVEGPHSLVTKIQTRRQGVALLRVVVLFQPVAGAIVDFVDPDLKGIGTCVFVYSCDFSRIFQREAVPLHPVFQGVHGHHDRVIGTQLLLDALYDVDDDAGPVLKAVASVLIRTGVPVPGHETGEQMVCPGVHVHAVKTSLCAPLGRVDKLLFDDLDLLDGQLFTGGLGDKGLQVSHTCKLGYGRVGR